ncbi:MAG: hypothetical protein ABI885_11320 [Gammaproteobacteria bacterium]
MNVRGALLLVLIVSTNAIAYETGTHALATIYAARKSNIFNQEAHRRLGIDLLTMPVESGPQPFGAKYFDMGSELRVREAIDWYEKPLLPESALTFDRELDNLTIAGWLARGAIREDDSPIEGPPDDPLNGARPFNHFFDPAHNLPLTYGGDNGAAPFLGAVRNPDWALGVQDAFANPPQANELRQNHFSILDAREAMWRALTLRSSTGPLEDFGGLSKEAARKAYWATTFRALGNVVHMIQDLAQPQHARNEPHSGIGPHAIQAAFTGHGSVIENYIETRARGRDIKKTRDFGGGAVSFEFQGKTLPALDTYPVIPQFSRYADYFSTSPGSISSPGWGIADFTNRKFFSAFKNLGVAGMELPSSDTSRYSSCLKPAFGWDDVAEPDDVKMEMLCTNAANPLIDEVSGASLQDFPMTAKSAWDKFLNLKALPGTYQLNRHIYDQQAEFLLPRAVAYSAGLIDYFFRGQMEIALPAAGVYAILDHAELAGDGKPSTGVSAFKGFKKLRLRLRNATPDIQPPGNGAAVPQAMGIGKLAAVMKFRRNTCYTDDLAGSMSPSCRGSSEEMVVSNLESVESVATSFQELTFTFDTEIPINMTDAYLQVVFRGALGAESDAVAVATNDVSEPTYASYFNATDMIWLDGTLRTRDEIASSSSLRQKITVPNCLDYLGELRGDCLQPQDHIGITMTVAGVAGSVGVSSDDLPVRRYLRFAYLTDSAALQGLTQGGDCVMSAQADAPTLIQQNSVIGPGSTSMTFSQYPSIRGIHGWNAMSCILRADELPLPDQSMPLPGMTSIDQASRPIALTNVPQW